MLLIGSVSAQQAKVIKLAELQELINSKNDAGVKVINFWATWCAPCVKELPLFEKVNQENKNVKVILVSMDIDLDPDVQKVQKFIDRKKILSQVYILDEHNPDVWINKIEKEWSGALPATLLIGTNGKRKFIERELHEGELESFIEILK